MHRYQPWRTASWSGPPAVPAEGQNKTQNKKKGWFYAESSVCKSPIFQVSDHTYTEEEGFLLELFCLDPSWGIKNRGSPRVQARRQGTVGGTRKLTADQSPVPILTSLPTPPAIIYSSEGLMVALCVLFRVFSCNQWKRQECVSSSNSQQNWNTKFQK